MPNETSIIAVTDKVPSGAVGSLTYWKLASKTAVDELHDLWASKNMSTVLGEPPSAPSPEVALARALDDQKERRRLVRPLAKVKDGWAIVRETVDDKTGDLNYTVVARVKLGDNLKPAIESDDTNLIAEVKDAYSHHLNTFVAADLSTWLVSLMTRLDAATLKPTGGFYFIPAGKRDTLAALREVMRGVGSVVYDIPAMGSESATVAFVDALTAEAKQSFETIMAEVQKGALGERALQNRTATINAFHKKVESYEVLLGTKLDDLKAQVAQLAGAVAAATLAATSD